jgi:hypothetical protein
MSQNSFLITVLMVTMVTIFLWRQLVKLVAALAIIVFCLGLYHFAQIMHL